MPSQRNHLGVDARKLHGYCLSGPKVLLERYQKRVRECLRFIGASPGMDTAEKCVRCGKNNAAMGWWWWCRRRPLV